MIIVFNRFGISVGNKSIATTAKALEEDHKARLLEKGAKIIHQGLNLSWDNICTNARPNRPFTVTVTKLMLQLGWLSQW
jgi:hypothetical protein